VQKPSEADFVRTLLMVPSRLATIDLRSFNARTLS